MMVMRPPNQNGGSKRRSARLASGFYAWRHRVHQRRTAGVADRLANAMRLLKMESQRNVD
jgi:hypothetical protein